jgi:hypothetical protein
LCAATGTASILAAKNRQTALTRYFMAFMENQPGEAL